MFCSVAALAAVWAVAEVRHSTRRAGETRAGALPITGAQPLTADIRSTRELANVRDVRAEAGRVAPAKLLKAYSNLPLSFEANQGQTDRQVKFLSRGSGYSLFLTSREAVLALAAPSRARCAKRQDLRRSRASLVRMRLVGSSPAPELAGLDELRISLDGATPEMYFKIRGIPALDKVIQKSAEMVATRRRLNSAWFSNVTSMRLTRSPCG